MVRAPLHFHGRIPVPEVSPLTYRDGVTHLELVYELSQYLKNILHPSLQSTVDQVVADAERLLSDATAQYVDGVEEFQRIHDAFMSDVNASLIALNDSAVTDLVEDVTSLFGQAIHLRSVYYPKYYGAIGDGEADDTEAIQRFLDAGHTVFDGGTYRITRDLTVNADNRLLEGNGVTFIADPPAGEYLQLLTINGDRNTITGFIITGVIDSIHEWNENKHGHNREGIRVNGAFNTITNNIVRNFFAWDDARAIRVDGIGGNKISGNHITNVGVREENTTGTETATARGIQTNLSDDATYWSTISDNHIERIRGQGSGGIGILNYAGHFPNRNGLFNIVNNTILNVQRRGIKVQASMVNVDGNSVADHGMDRAAYSAPAVDIQNASNVQVKNNHISANKSNAIHVTAASVESGVAERVNVVDNIITLPVVDDRLGVYVSHMRSVVVKGNVITGGQSGIAVGASNVGSIVGNVFTVQSVSGDAVRTTGQVERFAVANNVDSTQYRGREPFQIHGSLVTNVNNHYRGVIVE